MQTLLTFILDPSVFILNSLSFIPSRYQWHFCQLAALISGNYNQNQLSLQ